MTDLSESHARAVPGAFLVTHYRTARIDGIGIFYREAGPAEATMVALMQGFLDREVAQR